MNLRFKAFTANDYKVFFRISPRSSIRESHLHHNLKDFIIIALLL